MKKTPTLVLCFLVFGTTSVYPQKDESPILEGSYLGQPTPGLEPELFAPGIVSVGEGVHGNIVFSPDLAEAAWSPNYTVDGRNVMYVVTRTNGIWSEPEEIYLREGCSHGSPFYSYDGRRLYFLSGDIGTSGKTQDEKIYCLEKDGDEWSNPVLLDPVFDPYPLHWQFSLDKDNNLYFGSKHGDDESGEIYLSEFEHGKYLTPVKLPGTVNTENAEFSPAISPDCRYLIFTRMLTKENAPPQMNLFVSFRDNKDNWMEAVNLTEAVGLPVQSPFVMMSQARISPNGKYLFFTFFDGKGHMVYWVDAAVIEQLRQTSP